MTISELKTTIVRRRGAFTQVEQNKSRVGELLAKAQADKADAEEAQRIIQHVAQQTQKCLEYHVSELVTLAMASVFPDPYSLKLEFELKRGQSEARLQFARGDMVLEDPMAESGGGVVDVAAFALRVSLWSLANPRSRATIVLDEPLRFLSRDLQSKASAMIKELSRKLHIQFLIITHEEALLECADRVFQVTIKNGVSEVVAKEEK